MSESGEYYPISAQLRFYCTNNMSEYEACILGLRLAVDLGIQELLVLGDLRLTSSSNSRRVGNSRPKAHTTSTLFTRSLSTIRVDKF